MHAACAWPHTRNAHLAAFRIHILCMQRAHSACAAAAVIQSLQTPQQQLAPDHIVDSAFSIHTSWEQQRARERGREMLQLCCSSSCC